MSDATVSDGTRRLLPSRRAVLRIAMLSAAASAASGCTPGRGSGPGTSAPSTSPQASGDGASPDLDIGILLRAIADEESLLGFWTTGARRFPRQRPLLEGIVSLHAAQVSRLRRSLTGPTPTVTPSRSQVPLHVDDLEAVLAVLETESLTNRSTDCIAARSGLLAELFGSVAASHAVIAEMLAPTIPRSRPVLPTSLVDVSALTPCLAAEHAAVFGYGLLGGVLAAGVSQAPLAALARSSYDVHRDRRDRLVDLLTSAGLQPPASQPLYAVPFAVSDPASARRLARYLEQRCAGVYLRAIAATVDDSRGFASGCLVDCATRGADWGAAPMAFPGLTAA